MEVGIAPPPPGVTPNFSPPYTDVQVSLIVSTAVFLFLATGSLAIRLYTSVGIAKKWELDDVFITLAWATSVGFSALQMNALQYGWGKHTWDTSVAQLQTYMLHVNPMATTYMLSPTLAKLAILTLYYRIHPGRPIRVLILIVGICSVVYTVVLVVILTVPCNVLTHGNNACFQNSAIAHGFLNVIFDVVLILLPIPGQLAPLCPGAPFLHHSSTSSPSASGPVFPPRKHRPRSSPGLAQCADPGRASDSQLEHANTAEAHRGYDLWHWIRRHYRLDRPHRRRPGAGAAARLHVLPAQDGRLVDGRAESVHRVQLPDAAPALSQEALPPRRHRVEHAGQVGRRQPQALGPLGPGQRPQLDPRHHRVQADAGQHQGHPDHARVSYRRGQHREHCVRGPRRPHRLGSR